MGVTWVVRVDTDGGIGHNGLRPGCRYGKIRRFLFPGCLHFIAYIVQCLINFTADDFLIRYSGAALGIPVDHAYPAVNVALSVQTDEGVYYRIRKVGVHCEASTLPVTGSPQFFELFQDDTTVFFFPLPSIIQELLAGKVLFV